MFDLGYGGIDNGVVGVVGMLEKVVVFEFVKLLKGKLEVMGWYEIYMIWDDDIFVLLVCWVEIGYDIVVDLFIFIYVDLVC